MTNYTKSETLNNIPRHLKTQPGAPRTHLAYITDDEAKMLQKKKPGTPHGTRSGIPSYDYQTESGGWVSSGDANDFGGYSGSSSSYEPYSGNSGSDDYGIGSGGEFGGSINYGSGLPGGGPPEEDPYDWTTDSDYGGSTYVPWQTSAQENFLSAYGGLGLYGENNDQYEWNPFIAGFDPETGEPIYLTTSQFNEMMSVGEFGILPPGGTTGGPGPGRGVGWSSGRGGGGGRGGGYGGGMGGGTPKYGGDFAGENPWGLSHIQRAWINQLRGMNRGGIVSLC